MLLLERNNITFNSTNREDSIPTSLLTLKGKNYEDTTKMQ